MSNEYAVDTGELDVGLCTNIHEGGQVVFHDPVVRIDDPGFIFQSDRYLPLAVFEEDCIFRYRAIHASDIILHRVKAPASDSLTCLADHLIRSFREHDLPLGLFRAHERGRPKQAAFHGRDAGNKSVIGFGHDFRGSV